jgi:ATP-dependent helicase/nuclease subunit B
MPAIEQIGVDPGWESNQTWDRVAHAALAWLQRECLEVRDAVLLVPFVALAEQARAAFARCGGWQPRVETALTLAASCQPPAPPSTGSCSGNTVLDRLAAWALLRRQPWAQAWAQRDPGGFDGIVASVVDAAQVLRQAAGDRAPEQAALFWEHARAALRTAPGPAVLEASLLQLALEWAASSDPTATASLFELRPSAWMGVRMGGTDDVTEALLAQGAVPALLLNLDPADEAPFAGVAERSDLQRFLCQDFESEAQAAASVVLTALSSGTGPVALVVLDRELIRRVLALLQRQAVPVIDETGWKLATTSAATRVLSLLRAAHPQASPDSSLEWLKTWPGADAPALD